jgi:hypothetical protein
VICVILIQTNKFSVKISWLAEEIYPCSREAVSPRYDKMNFKFCSTSQNRFTGRSKMVSTNPVTTLIDLPVDLH